MGGEVPVTFSRFREEVYRYFRESGRRLPWRDTCDPYKILVSEVMLQQTQVDRVIEKYKAFVSAFPDFASLNAASLTEVYALWQGLGYNRRALALKESAEIVVTEHNGTLPDTVEELSLLPGIGKATACSICAFAFNKPTVFVETNIRTVFIHHFFGRKTRITDAEILALAAKAIDRDSPRIWYSALMDYGTMLRKRYPGLSRRSSRYKRQSPFRGSRREIRGRVLRVLLEHSQLTESSVSEKLDGHGAEILRSVLDELVREGFVTEDNGRFSIAR